MFNDNFLPQLATMIEMSRSRARGTGTHCTSVCDISSNRELFAQHVCRYA